MKHLPPLDEDEEDYGDYDDDEMSKSQDTRDSSHTPGSLLDQSTSPSTEASSTVPPIVRPSLSRKGSAQTTKPGPVTKGTSAMARDLQFYLNYFRNHMTVHHYSLKRDTHGFLKGDFLDWAMKFEPLKYAVAGYAAYFHTLSQPDGRMANFLQFYNESVSRLRISITKNKKQGLATFLTILQLASIEVRGIEAPHKHRANILVSGNAGRLGQPFGSSEGCIRIAYATVYTGNDHSIRFPP
jgi:hypothetical protein